MLDTFDDWIKGVKTALNGILEIFKGIFNGDIKQVLNGFKMLFKRNI